MRPRERGGGLARWHDVELSMHNPTRYQLDVGYYQIAVCSATEDKPFPMWTTEHLSQGFAWRPTSAVFSTLQEGDHLIELSIDPVYPRPSDDATRIIEVPFDAVDELTPFKVATTTDNVDFTLLKATTLCGLSSLMTDRYRSYISFLCPGPRQRASLSLRRIRSSMLNTILF
jgi:hypothetical protein